jgi:hypothetical protein
MKHKIYLHLSKPTLANSLEKGVIDVIKEIDTAVFHGSSKLLRRQITDELKKQGWSSKVKLSVNSSISITAMNRRTALCLQTGNMGRFYADLLKLQYLFKKRKIDSAIYILPQKVLARKIGSNIANFERLVTELAMFEDVITVPIFVVGLH